LNALSLPAEVSPQSSGPIGVYWMYPRSRAAKAENCCSIVIAVLLGALSRTRLVFRHSRLNF
jgi:hypothetical protein